MTPENRRKNEEQVADDESQKDSFAVDIYGVKVPLQPRPDTEDRPDSVVKTLKAIGKRLLSLCAGPFELADDAIQSARALVRGIGKLPAVIEKRVGRAHDKADRLEGKRQAQLEAGAPPPTKQSANDKLTELVQRLQANGVSFYVKSTEDGDWIITVVSPHMLQAAIEESQKALDQLRPEKALPAPRDSKPADGGSPDISP